MPEPATALILSKLGPVKNQAGGGWLAHCPVTTAHKHGDRNPSLSVKEEGGKVLLHCFTGCTVEDIVAALGLTMEHLFSDGRGRVSNPPLQFQKRDRGRLMATYQYGDGDGHVLAEKGRFEYADGHKSFLWRPLGTDGWPGLEASGLHLTDLALWGAEMVKAAPLNATVYYVEGEKAALACRQAGLLAVTFAGGASTKDFGAALELLRDRKVALWPDNDPAGRVYMATVEARLRGMVTSLRTVSVDAPPRGDAWEYFDGGGDPAELEGNAKPLSGPSVEILADDALRVTIPSPVGTVSLKLTDIEAGARRFEAELTVTVTAPGYPTEPYEERVDLLSHSGARDGLRRDLDNIYGKDLGWTRLLNTAFAVVRKAYGDHERSVDVTEIEDTGQDLFLLDPLLPYEAPTILFGDGGSLKSYLAFALSLALSSNETFLRLGTAWGPVIVVDYEDTERNFRRRMNRIAAGMGIEIPPGMIRYLAARGVPFRDLLPNLRKLITELAPALLIVDSVGTACDGKPEDAVTALAYMRAVAKLGVTSLHLAHITKEAAMNGHTQYPFGSVFWHNEARRTWFVSRSQDEESDDLDLGLYCRKVNDGPRPHPIGVHVHFEGLNGPITFTRKAIEDTPALADQRDLAYRLRDALRTGEATVNELRQELDEKTDNVKKALKRHKDWFVVIGMQKVNGRNAQTWGLKDTIHVV